MSVSSRFEEAHVADPSGGLSLKLDRGADLLEFKPAIAKVDSIRGRRYTAVGIIRLTERVRPAHLRWRGIEQAHEAPLRPCPCSQGIEGIPR